MNNTSKLSSTDGRPWEVFAEELDMLWGGIDRLTGEVSRLKEENRKLRRDADTNSTLINILILWQLLCTGFIAWFCL